MEFETLAAAIKQAQRSANVLRESWFVLPCSGDKPYFVCGPNMKRELWPDRTPVCVINPQR